MFRENAGVKLEMIALIETHQCDTNKTGRMNISQENAQSYLF